MDKYNQRGVSASKEDVHNAIKNIDKGLYPNAFCKIIPDLTGRRKEVRLTPDGYNQDTLDLTSLPQATYLLTLTTADGRQHALKLLKQSDIFAK